MKQPTLQNNFHRCYEAQIEKYRTPHTDIIMLVCAAIIIRNLVELYLKQLSGLTSFSPDDWINWWIHFPLFYLTLWLGATLGFSWLLSMSLWNSGRLTTPLLFIIIIGPIVDTLTVGGGVPYLYVKSPEAAYHIVINLLNPFIDLLPWGVSPGPRVEVALAILAGGVVTWRYTYNTPKVKIMNMLIIANSTYLWIVILCAWPAILNVALKTNNGLITNPSYYAQIYGIICFSILVWIYFLHFPVHSQTIYNFFRLKRFVHYLLLASAGSLIYLKSHTWIVNSFTNLLYVLPRLISGYIALIMIFISTTIFNDLYDQLEDTINNRRFLYDHPELRSHTTILAWITFGVALLFSLTINSTAFYIIIAWFTLNIIYSIPPIRLKRWFPASNIIIAVASVLSVIFGSLLTGAQNICLNELGEFLTYVLVISFIGSFIKDLPDVQGDIASRIRTLPTLLPPKKYIVVYIILIIACYALAITYAINISIFGWLIVIPATMSILTLAKNYCENRELLLYYFASIIIIIFLYITSQ